MAISNLFNNVLKQSVHAFVLSMLYLSLYSRTIFKRTDPCKTDYSCLGRQGIREVHANSLLPVRHREDIAKLSEQEKVTRKADNKSISSVRMKVEHVIGRIKNFKIVAKKYRNRRKRLLMRFNLICGIVNF